MLSDVAALQKPGLRKRSLNQSSATDGITAGQVLESLQTGTRRCKVSSSGSWAVANVAEPAVGYDVDLILGPVFPSASTIAPVSNTGYYRAAWLNAAQSLTERTYVFDDIAFRNCVTCPPLDQPGLTLALNALHIAALRIASEPSQSIARNWYSNEASAEDRAITAPFMARLLGAHLPEAFSALAAEVPVAPTLEPRDEQLTAEANYLKALDANWDGYGAKPLAAEAVDELVSILREALSGINVPAPDLIPGAGGSIQAEWRRKGYEVFFLRSRDGERELHVENVKTGEQFFFEGSEAIEMLRGWAKKIAD